MGINCIYKKWSIFAKIRMLSVALVQVGPALPLVAAATASCAFFSSSLHCTEWPQMKTALAIWGRHDKAQHYYYSSSSSSSPSMNTCYYLRIPCLHDHLCVTIMLYYLPIPFLLCVVMNKHFSIQFNSLLGKIGAIVGGLSCRHNITNGYVQNYGL